MSHHHIGGRNFAISSYNNKTMMNKMNTMTGPDDINLNIDNTTKFETEAPANESFYKIHKLSRVPFLLWILGLILNSFAILLLYNCAVGKDSTSKLFDGFNGDQIWEYFVVAFLFIIGITFFVVAKYEKITINKNVIFF